ncbi:MAG TPA: hypothetical protein VLV18_05915 [Terriglobales bacterium]|nr:hypothetical protein [Terriglobales bacterium]
MSLVKSNPHFNDGRCDVQAPAIGNSTTVRAKNHGVGLRSIALIVYANRFKDLRRDRELIRRNQQMGNTYSQLARQLPK